MMFLVVLTSILIGGAFYLEDEYTKNFNSEDANHLLDSYHLITETEKLLQLVSNPDEENIYQSIREVSARLASFNAVQANPTLSVERQTVLNRYYQRLHEFGVNLSKKNPSVVGIEIFKSEFEEDLTLMKIQQEELFILFQLTSANVESGH